MLQRVLFELGYSFDKQQQRLENRQQQQRWLQLWQLLEDQKRFEEKTKLSFQFKEDALATGNNRPVFAKEKCFSSSFWLRKAFAKASSLHN